MQTILTEEGAPVAYLETLLAMIEGSIGSNQYLRLFVYDSEKRTTRDVIENGRFPCAFFASAMLKVLSLIQKDTHTMVTHTIEDLIGSGWYQIDQFRRGAVIVWGPKVASDGNPHKHIGFYVGENMAVSTDGVTGVPTKHHVTYGIEDGLPVRTIEALFFHEKLRR